MSGPTIRKPLPCAKCGYDLEGLEAGARCPECGHEIVATLAARLDPATESLARPRELLRTAWAIDLACAGSVLACAIAVAPVLAEVQRSLGFPPWLAPGIDAVRTLAPAVALVGASLGLAATLFILPWSRERGYPRARWVGAAGFAAWTVLSAMPPSFEVALGALGAVAAVAASMTPLLRKLVPHSRLFRTARHATQTTRDLIVSAAVTLGSGIATLALRDHGGEWAQYDILTGVVAGASAMLLFVGLCYRLVNAHWVLRSVRRPAPRVDDVIGHPR